MAKGSGATRATGPGRGEIVMSGREFLRSTAPIGETRETTFGADTKLSDFRDEGQFVNGGSYSLENADGYIFNIETENGYNEDYRANGTMIMVSVTKPDGTRGETLINDFVEGNPMRESGGREVYTTDKDVERRINRSMPYYAERVNNWIKNNR